MDLKEILEKVDDESVKTAITELIDAETQKGISYYNKKDKELLSLKAKIKESGRGDDESVDDYLLNISKTKDVISEKNSDIDGLNRKFDDLLERYNDEKKLVIEKDKKNSDLKIVSKLTESIGDKLYAAKYIINDYKDKFKIEDDEVIGLDGKSFNSMVDLIMEENKESQKTEQKSGGGTKLTPTQPKADVSFGDALKAKMGI